MRNLILSGGPGHHPYPATSARVARILEAEGIASDVTEDVEGGLAVLAGGGYGMLTVNALRWRMLDDKYAPDRERWGMSLSPAGRGAVRAHLAAGRPLLGLHTAPICFDDWAEWGDILGAHWVWGTSRHPDLGPASISVRVGAHEIVDGVGDFEVVDEVYAFMDVRPDVKALATGCYEGVDHPLVWAREVGRARVVYDALGHDERSLAHPVHETILRQAGRWLLGRPDA